MAEAGAVTLFAADVPLGDRFRLYFVIDRMAPIAERSGGTLHVVRSVMSGPPIGAGLDVVGTPDFVGYVPLGGEREVVVANLFEVPLLPFAAVGEGDIGQIEGE